MADIEYVRSQMTEVRKCILCGTSYTENGCVSKWECSEHPGVISEGRFTCCGTYADNCVTPSQFYLQYSSIANRGCVKCDHKDVMLSYCNSALEISTKIITATDMKRHKLDPTHAEKLKGGYYRLYRYDRKQNEARIRKNSRMHGI